MKEFLSIKKNDNQNQAGYSVRFTECDEEDILISYLSLGKYIRNHNLDIEVIFEQLFDLEDNAFLFEVLSVAERYVADKKAESKESSQ